MPGTIQVSVLDFMGSSWPHSPMSLKVSMGKIEYQTWNSGEFSFPLTTLRDLIITLLDAEGNAISHSGVKTTLVIEKGVWEDIFPLEGGGHVHMKLQFFLSEEDHTRIRIVRESALKKKYDEYVSSSSQFSGIAASVKSDEISDSKACLPGLEAINTVEVSARSDQSTYPNASCKDPQYGGRSEGQSLTAPASQAFETNITGRGIEEKRMTLSPENGRSEQTLLTTPASQEVDPHTNEWEMVENGTQSSAADALGEHLDLERSEERQEKSQSTVRKMICALEGSSQQGVKSHINTSAKKSQSNRIKKESLTKDPCLKDYKTGKTTPTYQSSDIPTDESRKTLTNIKKRWEHFAFGRAQDKTFHTTRQLELSGQHKAPMKKERISPQNLMKVAAIESATSLAIMQNDRYNNAIKGISNIALKLLTYDEGSYKSSGAWIFPDEENQLCITAGGKNVMVLIRDCSIGAKKNHQPEVNLQHIDLGDDQKTSSKLRKTNVETSGGPVRQAINMAIMVGFGLLVLLTKQRKRR